MGGGAFIAMLRVGAFLLLIWGASRVSRLMGISSIVLEIVTGLVFSPGIAGLMPKEYAVCYYRLVDDCESLATRNHVQQKLGACDYDAYMKKDGLSLASLPMSLAAEAAPTDAHRRLSETDFEDEVAVPLAAAADWPAWLVAKESPHERRLAGSSSKGKTKYDTYGECLEMACKLELAHECTLTPDIFSFVGHIGVGLMIFESGMHFDFDKAKECGPLACVIACLGTFLPLIFGTAVIMLLCGKPMYPEGISAGTALAPTSVGIALKLLNEAKQLQKRHGQIIITAAFVDDILSLVLFNCLFALGAGDVGFLTFLPAILGILGMVGILIFAATGSEPMVLKILEFAPKKPDRKLSPEHEILFLLMMIMVLIFGTAFFYAGTHLWGCFMAGMCFAKLHFAHHVWVKQTKRVTSWMIRIFFSCTVAFSIPIESLLSIDAFWKGSIMGVGPCIMTKVLCAFWVPEIKWVIGWAMVGRAEFAYLIAQLAASSSMMSDEVFSIVIWSLLYATVFAPFLFRSVLAKFVKAQAIKEAGGSFTPEQEADWQREHSNLDFRQSGHLPDLQEIDNEIEKEKHSKDASASQGLAASTFNSSAQDEKPAKPVMSAYEENDRHNEHVEKPLAYAAAPVPQKEMHAQNDQQLSTSDPAARGSGFLCCLFFRKIVIM